MTIRDRVSRTTIDETGRQTSDFTVRLHGSQLEPEDIAPKSSILAAANAANYYGEDAERFARECDKATEYLISRVAASGVDKRRFARRRERRRLTADAMANAGVPQATWTDWMWRVLTLGSYVAPPPWNVVIAAVLFAVERYLGGE